MIKQNVTDHGFNYIEIRHGSGSSVTVCEYGGQITSWKDSKGQEILFMSPRAVLQAGKAIRGGIPIVFPQFGKGALPAHGFARTSIWSRVRESISESGPVSLVLRLTDSEETRKIWPYEFIVELEIVLTETLLIKLRVTNRGKEAFEFQSALHSYFSIGEIKETSILGLKGTKYRDFLKKNEESIEEREECVISELTDRVYLNSPSAVAIKDTKLKRSIEVTKKGFEDTVVWNPWRDGSSALTDLETASYRKFICVESGNISLPIKVAAGQSVEAEQVCRVARS